MKSLIKLLVRNPLVDILLSPFLIISALIMKIFRKIGVEYLPISKNILFKMGIYPLTKHYYEPMFDYNHLQKPLNSERNLPGIDWRVPEQMALLSGFRFSHELEDMPTEFVDNKTFHFGNEFFEAGDAEYWYNLIRLAKPRRIIEIGSGNSTKLARLAIARNTEDNPNYSCEHICIEPYEAEWLDELGVQVIRKKVEEVELDFFQKLDNNDILFIDSSHVIRPQGDVLYEFLEILPLLGTGVIVHIHDIFTPRDYLDRFIKKEVRLWNEQYLLEAFLTNNSEWEILGALNFLHHNYFDLMKEKCPFLTKKNEPGSFYMRKKRTETI